MRKIRLKERVLALALAVLLTVGMIPANSLVAEAADNCKVTFELKEDVTVERVLLKGTDVEFTQDAVDNKKVTVNNAIALNNGDSYVIYAGGYGLPVEGKFNTVEESADGEEVGVNVEVNDRFERLRDQFTTTTVTGAVKDANGKGIADITVTCGDKTATTNRKGEYKFEGLTVNRTLTITANGNEQYAEASTTVVTNAKEVTASDILMGVQTYEFRVTGYDSNLSKVTLNGAEDLILENVPYGTKVTLKISDVSNRCKVLVDGEEVTTKEYTVKEAMTVNLTYKTAAAITEFEKSADGWTNQDVTLKGKVVGLEDNFKVQLLKKEDLSLVEEKTDKEFEFTVACEEGTVLEETYLLNVVDDSTGFAISYNTDGIEVKIDKVAPVVGEVTWSEGAYKDAEGNYWSNGDETYTVDVTDADSGINEDASDTFKDVEAKEDGTPNAIKVYDNAGNKSEVTVEYKFDKDAPVITESTLKDVSNVIEKGIWNQEGNFDIEVNAPTDAGCGVKENTYVIKNGKKEVVAKTLLTGNTITIAKDVCEATGTYTVELTSVDNLGNSDTKVIATFGTDVAGPEITFAFAESLKTKVFELFGIYTKEDLVVTVTATDDMIGFAEEDKDSIFTALSYNGLSIEPSKVTVDSKTAVATYKITLTEHEGLWSAITVNATDALGNTNANNAVAKRSDLLDGGVEGDLYIMVEDDEPTVKLNVSPKPNYIPLQSGDITDVFNNTREWYNDTTVTYTYVVEDADSGLYQIGCTLNEDNDKTGKLVITPESGKLGKEGLTSDDRDDVAKKATVVLNLSADDCDKTGKCEVVLNVEDNAGCGNSVTKTIYFDTNAPVISDVKFIPSQNGYSDKTTDSAVIPTDYGFFFVEKTTVTFKVTDYIAENIVGSGVNEKTVIVTKVDQDGRSSEADVIKGVNNQYSFVVEENFKGYFKINAEDNVGNVADSYNPEGMIIETENKHGASSSAIIDLPEAGLIDGNKYPLYSDVVEFDISVEDKHSGINNVTYESDNKTYEFKADLTNGINNYVGFDSEKAVGENNIITKINAVDSYGDGTGKGDGSVEDTYTVKLNGKCNAGHDITVEPKTFSVDTMRPRTETTWASDAQVQNDKYYNKPRTATVEITERNFDRSKVTFDITGPVQPTISWSESGDVRTATLTFSEDGDYTFKSYTVTDLAGHSTTTTVNETFTIDQVNPVINVTYDNNNSRNGNYYKAPRTATITITEHNFRASDVTFTTNGSVSGNWSSSGDTHTTTVYFGSDNDYTFDVAYTDLAGNAAADYQADSFTVDLTNPVVSISGVEDRSANQGTVAPVITISDKNFDPNGVEITLVGANRGKVNVSSMMSSSTSSEGRVISFANFPEGMDDIYTLTAKSVDKAGNETTKTILFSVNRDGSTYKVNEYTKKLIEKGYTNDPQNIVIVETNVDTLTFIELSYTKDGKLVKLVEGKDYKISMTGGEDSWKQYTYTIFASAFEEEGKYNINISSVDRAKNESNNKVQEMTVEFVVDKTVPTMAISNLENRGRYDTNTHQFIINVKDNTALSRVEIYMENEAGELVLVDTLKGKDLTVEDGKLYIDIKSKDGFQKIKIIAYDEAGNATEPMEYSVLVTENQLLLFYANKPLFFGSIFGILAVIGFVFFLIAKRRKDEEEENAAAK